MAFTELERRHVLEVYNDIAGHFSETRHKPWPRVAGFLSSLPVGSLVADIGCGNGKYNRVNKDIVLVGCDTSRPLLDICTGRGMDTVECGATDLPFKSMSFDASICIAVIHHLATEERRLEAIKNMIDLLIVNGEALIYVWAFEQQDKKGKTSNYVKSSREEKKADLVHEQSCLESDLVNLPVHCNRTKFEQQDVLVPWKNKEDKSNSRLRYYHVFREFELEKLIENVANAQLVDSYFDQGNWCAIVKRIR